MMKNDFWTDFLGFLLVFLPDVYSLEDQALCGITSDPVVIGQSVTLFCSVNTSDCMANKTRIWTTGKEVLMMNGQQKENFTRYREEIYSCVKFGLTISNISELDLNNQYFCEVGFHRCHLMINIDNVEYHPRKETIKYNLNVSATGLEFYVDIPKVSPVPMCTIVYGGLKLENYTRDVSRVGQAYQVTLEAKYDTHVTTCPVLFNVTCLVGKTTIPLFQEEYNNCKFSDVIGSIEVFPILSCILGVVCLGLLGWSISRNRQKILDTITKQLPNRSFWDNRRPILAFLTTTVCMTFILTDITVSSQELTLPNKNNMILTVSCFVLTLLFTPISLCFLSNPDTVSIHEGFINAGHRFANKIAYASHQVFCCTREKYTDRTDKSIPERDRMLRCTTRSGGDNMAIMELTSPDH